jgi:hypothetical protein
MIGTYRRLNLGCADKAPCEALAWPTSPAAIAARERAQAGGGISVATQALLRE